MLGKGGQVVDVFRDVNNAAHHLHHTVVSLLCILLVRKNEEEEASCLVGILMKLASRTMMARWEKLKGNKVCSL